MLWGWDSLQRLPRIGSPLALVAIELNRAFIAMLGGVGAGCSGASPSIDDHCHNMNLFEVAIAFNFVNDALDGGSLSTLWGYAPHGEDISIFLWTMST
ncbi:hypothetical protein U1Q18_021536 [Sarracenia purpurea var. burkii]